MVRLGTVSLGWNIVAPMLHLVLPRRTGTRIGRAAISAIYRSFWRAAGRLGMMQIDSSALDVLRDEPGGLVVAANHPAMLTRVSSRDCARVCVMKAELLATRSSSRLSVHANPQDIGRLGKTAVNTLRGGGRVFLRSGPERARPVHPFKPVTLDREAGASADTTVSRCRSPIRKCLPLLNRRRAGRRRFRSASARCRCRPGACFAM